MFSIKYRDGYVAGYNSQHMMVQKTADAARAKSFKTIAAAKYYIERFADIGYGLVSGECQAVFNKELAK